MERDSGYIKVESKWSSELAQMPVVMKAKFFRQRLSRCFLFQLRSTVQQPWLGLTQTRQTIRFFLHLRQYE